MFFSNFLKFLAPPPFQNPAYATDRGVAFASDERQAEELNTRIGKASAVMRALHSLVVMKREQSKEAKLSIFKSFVPIFTYSHESRVTTERMRSQVQVLRSSESN